MREEANMSLKKLEENENLIKDKEKDMILLVIFLKFLNFNDLICL